MFHNIDQEMIKNNVSYNINDVTIIMEGVLRYVDIIETCENYKYLCISRIL